MFLSKVICYSFPQQTLTFWKFKTKQKQIWIFSSENKIAATQLKKIFIEIFVTSIVCWKKTRILRQRLSELPHYLLGKKFRLFIEREKTAFLHLILDNFRISVLFKHWKYFPQFFCSSFIFAQKWQTNANHHLWVPSNVVHLSAKANTFYKVYSFCEEPLNNHHLFNGYI